MIQPLLALDEPSPVSVTRPDGRSALLLTGDHAGRRVPRALGRLGLPEAEFDRHIAWDIGIAGVSAGIAQALDAVLIEQVYSRLVIDCNRPPRVEGSIPAISESTEIPGNLDLSPEDRAARVAEVFWPYHARIEAEITARTAAGRETILVAMHSFTPVYKGVPRPWHIGTLYGRDERLAVALRDLLVRESDLVVGHNEPYAVSDDSDHAIPVHGERNGLVHVGIEIRQDLIATREGEAAWADRLSRLLPLAAAAACGHPVA